MALGRDDESLPAGRHHVLGGDAHAATPTGAAPAAAGVVGGREGEVLAVAGDDRLAAVEGLHRFRHLGEHQRRGMEGDDAGGEGRS
jgi:hypothetical protein